MTMHKRRSLFVTGILLSALVLFGSTGAQAQTGDAPDIQGLQVRVTGYDSLLLTWTELTGQNLLDTTAIEVAYVATPIGTTADDLDALDPETMTVPKARGAATIDGLTYETMYLIGVRAVNANAAADTGEEGDWAVANAETDEIDDPARVTGLELEALDGMIMAMWDEPEDDIGIHHYKVIVTADGGFSLTMGSGSADTEYTIMNLENGTEYTVKIAAVGLIPGTDSVDVDGDGTPDRLGPESAAKKATPTGAPEPEPEPEPDFGMPTVTLGMPTHDSVMVSWTAVEGTDHYNLSYIAEGGDDITINKRMELEHTLTGLMPETNYGVSVCANSAVPGRYGCSDRMEFTTMAAPSLPAPMNVMATPGDGSIMVEWDAVADATMYEVRAMAGGTTTTEMVSGATMHTFTGLTNGMEYMVSVRSGDADGFGDWSEAMGATPMPTEPVPALPLFGMLALGAGLVAAGRRRLRTQRLLRN